MFPNESDKVDAVDRVGVDKVALAEILWCLGFVSLGNGLRRPVERAEQG